MTSERPRTMQAAILVEQNKPLVLGEVTLPEALAVGQVHIKLHTSGICGSQLGEIDGVKGPDKYLPHLLGHEGTGTVLGIGPGVTTVTIGDKVVLHWRPGTGIQAAPPLYEWEGQPLNAGWVTTFNEQAIVSENRVTPMPDGCGDDVGALFGCAVTTGFGVVENNAQVKIGQSVVVFGAGGVGLSVVQAAAMVSAYPIIAVDLHDNRLALAQDLGATHVINAAKEDAEQAIAAVLNGTHLDCFIDNTGQPNIIQLGYRITGPEGRVVLVGVPKAGADTTLPTLPLHFGKVLTGSHGGEAQPATDIPRYGALYAAGRLKLDDLITKTYPLIAINDAIDDMRSGQLAGRCLIQFD